MHELLLLLLEKTNKLFLGYILFVSAFKAYEIKHGPIFLKCIFIFTTFLKMSRSLFMETNQVICRVSQTILPYLFEWNLFCFYLVAA